MRLKNILKSILLTSILLSVANTEVITNIDIQGNQRVDASTILTRTAIKAGDDIDDDDINELVKLLHDTELFDDVKIQKRKKGKLIIKVKEKPIVRKIQFSGNKKLKTENINKMLKDIVIKPNETLSTKKVKYTQMALLEIYKKLGIYNATVNPKIIKRSNNKVDLIIEIS